MMGCPQLLPAQRKDLRCVEPGVPASNRGRVVAVVSGGNDADACNRIRGELPHDAWMTSRREDAMP